MITSDEFHKACKGGDITAIRQYIAEGGNVDVRDNIGWTGLMYVARLARIDCLQELVSAGADVNIQDNNGWGALILLMFAAHTDRPACLRILISAGADIDVQDKHGWTPLLYAAKYGFTDCVCELVSSGAEVANDTGGLALTRALIYNYYAIAEVLAEAGADIYSKDIYGKPAIYWCKNKRIKDKLIQLYQQRINTKAAIKSAEKPVIIKGFDSEL